MIKKTLSNYKKAWKKESKGKSKKFKEGLKLGLLATTNNKQIRSWLKGRKK